MVEQKYALYVEGNDKPCGTLRESMVNEVPKELKRTTGRTYYIKPISDEEAKAIDFRITGGDPKASLDGILERVGGDKEK